MNNDSTPSQMGSGALYTDVTTPEVSSSPVVTSYEQPIIPQASSLETPESGAFLPSDSSANGSDPSPILHPKKPSINKAFIVIGGVAILIVVLVAGIAGYISRKNTAQLQPAAQSVNEQGITLGSATPDVLSVLQLKGSQNKLIVNGDLIATGRLSLANGNFYGQFVPNNLTANREYNLPDASGTICLDTNNCNFVTGSNTVGSINGKSGAFTLGQGLGLQGSTIVATAKGTTIAGQTADFTLGAGLSISGTTIFSSLIQTTLNNIAGDVILQGTTGQISVDVNGSIVTLSTPQDIASTSTPTFSGIALTAVGTQNGNVLCDISNNCGYSGGAGSSYLQGGNSFGMTATLGTNDNNDLVLETNGQSRLTLDTNGNVAIGAASQGSRLYVAWNSGDTAPTAAFGTANIGNNQVAVLASSYSNVGVAGSSQLDWGVIGQTNGDGTGASTGSGSGGVLGIAAGATNSYGVLGLGTLFGGGNNIGVGAIGSSYGLFAQSTESSAIFAKGGCSGLFGCTPSVAPIAILQQYSDATTNDFLQAQNASGQVFFKIAYDGKITTGLAGATNGQVIFNNNSNVNTITLDAAIPSADRVITLPNASGTICLTSGNCAGVGGTGDILNNGNTNGSAITIGTNDGFDLNFETNNSQVGRFTVGGAFQVNSTGAAGTVEKFRVNTPTTVDNLANVIIGTSATTSKGLVVQGVASQAANLQEWQDSTGTVLARITSLGNLVIDRGGAAAGGTRLTSLANANAFNSNYVNAIFGAYSSTAAQQINFQADGAGTIFNILNQAGSAAGELRFSFGYNNTLARLTSAGVFQLNSTGTAGTVEKFRVNTPTTVDNLANAIIGTSAATSKGLVVQGVVSQSANLQEWQASDGQVLAKIASNGNMTIGTNTSGSANTSGTLTLQGYYSGGAIATSLVFNVGQSNSVISNSGSNSIDVKPTQQFRVLNVFDSNSPFSVQTRSGSQAAGQVAINVQNAATPGLIITGATSQTADLVQHKDVNGIVMSSVSASGAYNTNGVTNTFGRIAIPASVAASAPQSGGSLVVSTPYYWVVTATTASGETIRSAEVTQTPTAGNQTVTISWAQVTGATGYKVYRTTVSGQYFSPNLVTTITNGNTLSYADTGSAVTAGNPPSSSTGSKLVLQGWQSQSANLQEWQDSTGAVIASVSVDLNGSQTGGKFTFVTQSAAALNSSYVGAAFITHDAAYNQQINFQSDGNTYLNILNKAGSGVGGGLALSFGYNNPLVYFRSNGALELNSTGATGTVEKFRINTPTTVSNTTSAIIATGADANVGLVIQGNSATQSASLQQWQDSTGAVLSSISSAGNLVFGASASSGTGVIRLQNNTAIGWRNAANTADKTMYLSSSNVTDGLNMPGNVVVGGSDATAGALYFFNSGVVLKRTAASGLWMQTSGNGVVLNGSGQFGVNPSSSTFAGGTVEKFRVNDPVTVDNLANTILTANAATSKPLVVQGFTSQSANLQEWQTSAGTALTVINASGNIGFSTGGLLYSTAYTQNKITMGASTSIQSQSAVGTEIRNYAANGTVLTVNMNAADGGGTGGNGLLVSKGNLFMYGGSSNYAFAYAANTNNGNDTYINTNGEYYSLRTPNASANYGLLNLGENGTAGIQSAGVAWDGVTSGRFSGSANGTYIALFAKNTFAGNFIDAQVAGSSVFTVSNTGLGYVGALKVASTGTPGTVEKFRVNTPTTVDNLANAIISTNATTSKGLVIQGVASQAANLQEWQTSAGTVVNRIASTGAMQLGFNIALQGEVSTGGTFADLIKRGASNNVVVGSTSGAETVISGNNQIMFSSGSGQLASFTATGFSPVTNRGVTFGGASNLWANGYFGSSAAASVALHVVASASQSGNLQQWEDSSNAVLSLVDASGRFSVGTTTTQNAANAKLYVDGTSVHSTGTSNNWTLNGVTRGTQFFTSESAASGSPASMSLSGSVYNGGTIATLGTFGYVGSFSGAGGSGSRTIIGALNEGRSTSTISGDIVFGTRSTAGWDNDQSGAGGGGTAYALYGSATTNTSTGGSNKTAYGVYGVAASSTNTTAFGGFFTATGTGTNVALQATTGNTGSIGLVVKGVGSQVADLQQWQNNSGTVFGKVTSSGSLQVDLSAGSAVVPSIYGNSSVDNGIEGHTSATSASKASIFAQPLAAGARGIIVKGFSGQTANLQEWQDNTGAVLASINASGVLGIGTNPATTGAVRLANGNSGGNNGIVFRNAANTVDADALVFTTSNILTIGSASFANNINGTYTNIFTGKFGISKSTFGTSEKFGINAHNTIDNNALAVFTTTTAATKGLVIQGSATQSANLQEWQDNSGAVLARVDNAGIIRSSSSVFNGATQAVTGVNTTTLFVQPASAGSIGVYVRGATSQSAELTQWQNSSNTPLLSITASGAIQGTNGSGTDIAGGAVTINGGQGTGTGAGGSILMQIAKPGTTGASSNSLTTVATISGTDGSLSLQNATNTTSAFVVKGSAGATNILQVDSSDTRVKVGYGNAAPSSASGVLGVLNNTTGTADTLVADNSTSTGTILVGKDNGTTVFTIGDNGVTTHQTSTNSTTALVVKDSAGTNNVLVVDTTNDRVGIGTGTAAPAYTLDVLSAGVDATTVAQFKNAGATSCTVQPGGTGFACSSDARLKTNVATVIDPLATVKQLRGVTFNWTTDPNGQTHAGFIAQELEQLIPSAVSTDSNGYKVANYTEIIPYLVGAAQAQDLQVTGLQQNQSSLQQTQATNTTTLTNLSSRVATLEQKVATLEATQPQGNNATFATLNVSGMTTLQDLKVVGSATIAQLTVTGNAHIAGNLTIDGHVLGNSDTRGSITIPAGQTEATYTFVKAYTTKPFIVASPVDKAILYSITPSPTGFAIRLNTADTTDTTLNFMVQE